MSKHSDRAEAFLAELKLLCVKHQIQISTSEYDHIQLWPLNGESFLHPEEIEDRAQEEKP